MYKPELMADVGAKSSVNSTRQHLEWRNRDWVCAGCFRCALNGVNIIASWQKYMEKLHNVYIFRWCFWHAKRMSRAACKAGRLRAALPSQRPVATFHIEVRPKGPSWAKSLKWSLVLSYSATASIESFNFQFFFVCNLQWCNVCCWCCFLCYWFSMGGWCIA